MAPESADCGIHERVLVLAPVGRDSELTLTVLRRAGVKAEAMPSVPALCAEIERGAGLALLTAEVLTEAAIAELGAALRLQPPWSDLPVLVFTAWSSDERLGAGALDRLQPLGNVSLVDRPVHIATLVSVLNAALRARRRQYQLRDLLQRLSEGVRQRDQFLAMLGHELRNPLSALSTALQVLEGAGAAPSDGSQDLVARQNAVVRRQAQVLGRLVDDLLEVSRVTSGKLQLQRRRLDVGELARRCSESLQPAARKQRLELAVDVGPAPVYVDGDPTRLEQVLLNVLVNAIKYTPEGGRVALTVRAEGACALVSVRDSGVGMDAEVLRGIFDLFQQAERTLHRAQGGLGIGLTLVRSIVELHGGTVVARSAGLGQGSEFVVTLPALGADATGAEPAPPSPPLAAAAPRRRVYVLEDHADNREGLVVFLQQLGHDVDSGDDGLSGARRIVETRPEVALVDIGLPGLDGFEVARRVRGSLGSAVYLVALTGYGTDEDRDRALAAGFDVHMAKPIDFLALRQMLAQAGRDRVTQLVR